MSFSSALTQARVAGEFRLRMGQTHPPAPADGVSGGNATLQLGELLVQRGFDQVLIVTDRILLSLGVVDPLRTLLDAAGVHVSVYAEVTPDPTLSVVKHGLQQLPDRERTAVVAFGGGSVIDAAKVMALSATHGRQPERLFGLFKGRRPALPLFAVPTTSGTGSEVTAGAVISDDLTHQKNLVVDPRVIPLAVAIDPKVLQGMPAAVTAETALDALTHALEAWMSTFASAESDAHASTAVQLIFSQLPVAYRDGHNLAARLSLGLAAHYAGLALNKASLGYVHAIAHQLGAHCGLPYILDFNQASSAPRLAQLARLLRLAEAHHSDAQAAARLVAEVNALIAAVHINTRIPGLQPERFEDMITAALREAHSTYPVPRMMNRSQMRAILQRIKAASDAA